MLSQYDEDRVRDSMDDVQHHDLRATLHFGALKVHLDAQSLPALVGLLNLGEKPDRFVVDDLTTGRVWRLIK